MFDKAKPWDSSTNWRDDSLRLKDGTNLIARLWFPNDEKGPWPALLMRQPYGRSIASTVTYAHPAWWAHQGYLVVIQDVRGQGDSDGEFIGFEQEASDTSQTHAWVRSMDECDGRLGTYGFSYQGLTQLIAEPGTSPPDCLAPAMTGLDERNHWSCDGGAHWWHISLAWGIQLAALKARRDGNETAWQELRRSIEEESYLIEGKTILEKYDRKNMVLKWLKQSTQRDEDWIFHKPLKSWLVKPMLLLGGWWDPHLGGLIDLYEKSLAAGGRPELHIGPATHLQWWEGTQDLHLKFFNRYLKNQLPTNSSTKSDHDLHLWNLSTNKWQYENSTKKNKKAPTPTWTLSSKGIACLDINDGQLTQDSFGSGDVHVVHDPWRAVPAKGGHLSPQPGPFERHSIAMRPDVATFTTSPLPHSLHLEGIPSVQITAKCDQKGFDLCLALSIVNNENNKAEQISTGVSRVEGENAKKALPRTILLQPLLADLRKGERLRLSIAGAAWPAIGINPGSGKHPIGAAGPHCLVITLSLNLTGSKLKISPLIRSKFLRQAHIQA